MLNKRIVQGVIAVVIIAVLIFMYRKYKNKSEYIIPPTAQSDTDATRQTRYSNDLVACETTYINAVNNTTDGLATTAITDALNACISSNVVSYYNARCPYLVPDANGSILALKGQSNPGTLAPATATYNTYKADIDAINAKYTPLIAAAGQTYSVSVIQAARKADFTGATRKYFATLCQDLYTTSTDTTSQALYRGWTSSATSSSAYGWNAANVTLDKIWEWAKYAGQAPTITGTTYTPPTAPLIGPTTVLAACAGSLYNTTPTGSTVPNWQLAADNGPGTVRNGVTFPWSTQNTAICPGSATFIPGATAANPLP